MVVPEKSLVNYFAHYQYLLKTHVGIPPPTILLQAGEEEAGSS